MKSGFVGIAGRPNVGKSTLMNAMIGEKIAITSSKPQTTRTAVKGIYTGYKNGKPDVQICFIDTPGLHKPKDALGSYMAEVASKALGGTDVILFVTDAALKRDLKLLEQLKALKAPKILVINKIDKISPSDFEKIYLDYEKTEIFDEIIGTDALSGKNVDRVLFAITGRLPEGPMYYPEEFPTDGSMRFIAGEIIREKLLRFLRDEVPHGVAVEIESYEEKPGVTAISAVIYCEKESHKGIIIGKGGHTLKGIGASARKDLESLLGSSVFLKIFVKVKTDWRKSGSEVAKLGYDKKNL